MRIWIFSILFVIGILGSSAPIFAQTINSETLNSSSINIIVTPQNPGPYEDVSLIIESYGVDLNGYTIAWKTGGKTLLSGIGRTSYSFRTGPAGSIYALDITIGQGNQTVQKRVIIQTNDMDILWEATNSYTPPFYKGKALPGPEASIRVTALPSGTARTTVFDWRRNDKSVASASGTGKQSFTFALNYLNETEVVSVQARAQTGSYRAGGSISIQSVTPEILVFEEKGTEGVYYNRAITPTYSPSGKGFTLTAKPFFFSIGKNESLLSYEWRNESENSTLGETKNVTLSANEQNSGSADISISITKINSIFEQIKKRFTLNV